MPTHTPSPHRFLAPKAPSAPQPKPKPRSNLRNVIVAPANATATFAEEEQDDSFTKPTPAKRFLVTPHRRTLSDEDHASVQKTQARPSQNTQHTQLTPRPKARRKFERVESIEEPQSSPSYPVDNDGFGTAEFIERDPASPTPMQQIQDDEDEEMLFALPEIEADTHATKRRRLTTPPSPISNHRSEPTTPITERHSTTHRFLVPPPRTPAAFQNISQTLAAAAQTPAQTTPAPQSASSRPHFILPPQPTSPPKPTKPLPEIFSPSRKTGRYINGGLAATMQSLIIETANTGFAAQDRGSGIVWGREKEDGVRIKVRVTQVSRGKTGSPIAEDEVECFPGYVVFARGTTEPGLYNASRAPSVVDDGGEMKVLLAGQGGVRGAGGVRIRNGAVVGIRAPMWDVEVDGEKWLVGVDWTVL